MDQKKQIFAEINDGKLNLNGDEISLQALSDLLQETTVEQIVNDLGNINNSLAKISALILENDSKIDSEVLKFSFPSYSTVYGIQLLLGAFKKMSSWNSKNLNLQIPFIHTSISITGAGWILPLTIVQGPAKWLICTD